MLGRPVVDGLAEPLGDGGATTPTAGYTDWRPWRYRGLALFVGKKSVRGLTTTDKAAETRRGVRVGDSLATARRAYGDRLACGTDRAGEGPEFQECSGKLTKRHWAWFGGDPIESIAVWTRQP